MQINETAIKIHENAKAHGWWEGTRAHAEIIALCHSELSESLEELRSGHADFYYRDQKPEGWAVEAVDCVIRIFDWLASQNIDIELVMKRKMEYNETRPYKHGRNF